MINLEENNRVFQTTRKKIEISIYFSITNLNINSVGSLIKTETGSFN